MSKLADAIVYFCENYPHKHELSKARLTKMIYLADWRSSIEHQRQLTDLTWVFNHYGPYLDDVVDTARHTPGVTVSSTQNMYGSPKVIVERDSGPLPPSKLTKADKAILDGVIKQTEALYWNDFIKLVYSTYPIVTQPRYQDLDLPALASAYNAQKGELTQ